MTAALTRLGILGMTVLLVAALTAGTDTQTRKAEATAAGAGVLAKAIPPATATTAPADAPKTDANAAAATGNLEPIPLELPKPCFIGTLENLPPGTHVKITEGPAKPRDPFLAPKGAKNVAFKRPVTASDMEPVFGTLDLITNGSKEAVGDAYVELGPGVQWVQVDLGSPLAIHALLLWHDHHQPMVYYDVIIQVSDDKDFITNVRTLFNNDHDNSAGMGIGEDWGYFETNEGLLLPAKGVKARYVRLYSNGNTGDDLNRYTEVEVYALPAGAGPAARPASAPGGKEVGARQDHRSGEAGPTEALEFIGEGTALWSAATSPA